VFGGSTIQSHVYMLPIEAGANLITIPMGHAMDALCYALGSELKDISATLANHYPEVDLMDENQKPIKKLQKTAYDFATISASTVNDGANVSVSYAPVSSRTGRDFVWEIIGSEGTLLLESAQAGGMGGHVQMSQPTVKLAMGQEELKDVEVEKAADPSFNVGKAWDAWAGVGLDKGYTVTTWEDAVLRHRMIEAIYRSAEKGTRENYV
jgi:predicted dehydrogenase